VPPSLEAEKRVARPPSPLAAARSSRPGSPEPTAPCTRGGGRCTVVFHGHGRPYDHAVARPWRLGPKPGSENHARMTLREPAEQIVEEKAARHRAVGTELAGGSSLRRQRTQDRPAKGRVLVASQELLHRGIPTVPGTDPRTASEAAQPRSGVGSLASRLSSRPGFRPVERSLSLRPPPGVPSSPSSTE
jgi:hypothetical protein